MGWVLLCSGLALSFRPVLNPSFPLTLYSVLVSGVSSSLSPLLVLPCASFPRLHSLSSYVILVCVPPTSPPPTPPLQPLPCLTSSLACSCSVPLSISLLPCLYLPSLAPLSSVLVCVAPVFYLSLFTFLLTISFSLLNPLFMLSPISSFA